MQIRRYQPDISLNFILKLTARPTGVAKSCDNVLWTLMTGNRFQEVQRCTETDLLVDVDGVFVVGVCTVQKEQPVLFDRTGFQKWNLSMQVMGEINILLGQKVAKIRIQRSVDYQTEGAILIVFNQEGHGVSKLVTLH